MLNCEKDCGNNFFLSLLLRLPSVKAQRHEIFEFKTFSRIIFLVNSNSAFQLFRICENICNSRCTAGVVESKQNIETFCFNIFPIYHRCSVVAR
jgi:hypothetical protein